MMLSKKSIGERLPSDVEVDAEPIDPVEYYKVRSCHGGTMGSKGSKLGKKERKVKDENTTVERQPEVAVEANEYCRKETSDEEKTQDSLQCPAEEEPGANSLENGGDESVYFKKDEVHFSVNPDQNPEECQEVGEEKSIVADPEQLLHHIGEKLKILDEPCVDQQAPPGWQEKSPQSAGSKQSPAHVSSPGRSKSSPPPESKESPSSSGKWSESSPEKAEESSPPSDIPSLDDIELTPADYHDMPDELKMEEADIFLMTSEDEINAGRHLQELFEREIRYPCKGKEGTSNNCKVYLMADMLEESKIDALPLAQDKCTMVLILITKAFCEDAWARYQKNELLVRCIKDYGQWTVVPLFTQPKSGGDPGKSYNVPAGLLSFKGLDMSRLLKGKDSVEKLENLSDGDRYFKLSLVQMLERREDKKAYREQVLKEKKEQWEQAKKIYKRNEMLHKRHRAQQQKLMGDAQYRATQQKLPKHYPDQSAGFGIPSSPYMPGMPSPQPASLPSQQPGAHYMPAYNQYYFNGPHMPPTYGPQGYGPYGGQAPQPHMYPPNMHPPPMGAYYGQYGNNYPHGGAMGGVPFPSMPHQPVVQNIHIHSQAGVQIGDKNQMGLDPTYSNEPLRDEDEIAMRYCTPENDDATPPTMTPKYPEPEPPMKPSKVQDNKPPISREKSTPTPSKPGGTVNIIRSDAHHNPEEGLSPVFTEWEVSKLHRDVVSDTTPSESSLASEPEKRRPDYHTKHNLVPSQERHREYNPDSKPDVMKWLPTMNKHSSVPEKGKGYYTNATAKPDTKAIQPGPAPKQAVPINDKTVREKEVAKEFGIQIRSASPTEQSANCDEPPRSNEPEVSMRDQTAVKERVTGGNRPQRERRRHDDNDPKK